MIRDRRGIIGMPIKLAVAVLVIATMTPVIVDMVDDAEDSLSIIDTESEARKIVEAVSDAFFGGYGCTVSVNVSIPTGESIVLGGSSGNEYSLRIMANGEVKKKILLERPGVPVLNDEIEISGDTVLKVISCWDGDRSGVRVET